MGLRGTKNNVIGFNEKVYLNEQNIFFFSCVHELESYSFDCNKKLVTIISYQSKVPNNNKSINNNLIQFNSKCPTTKKSIKYMSPFSSNTVQFVGYFSIIR
jgi:hypothetical protein